ncbi:MAG: DNA polymerase III subunit chi [Burkholderiaceae bacterium]|jgi:DNA polymerase-3 subunit chi|nr:DNA polymerase III subunit chi [Burkholderiaceae bacterium]
MTRIEFRTHIKDKLDYVCRWARKALTVKPDVRVVLFVRDSAQLLKLDEALWTFSDHDFLPHAEAGTPHASHSPILLACDNAVLPHQEILVNLSPSVPPFFARFERLIELVSTDEEDRQAGKQRYVHYRQRGYTLQHEVAG